MWSRRSSTRTRLSSSLATRSATVRPKNPEPTTMRSGLGAVTPSDCTVADPPPQDLVWPGRGSETKQSPPPRVSHGTQSLRPALRRRLIESWRDRILTPRSAEGGRRDLLARTGPRGIHPVPEHGDHPAGRGGAGGQRVDRRGAAGSGSPVPARPGA